MLHRHPVITGTGMICAAGCGVASVWESIRNNRSGLGPLTLFPSPRFGNHLVGQVREDVGALAGEVRGSRSDLLAWIAAREALTTAGLVNGLGTLAPERVGVILGSTVGGMLGSEKVLTTLLRENKHRFGPFRFHECAGAAELCAQKIGACGPVTTLSTACSAGAMAISMAAEMIERGEADVILAGAGDSLSRLTLNGFGSLLLLAPDGCRPFDARRAGISLGEGAGMLVIEAEATARARGATILARLGGWGASCDAFHATAPQPEGLGAFAALQRALDRDGLSPTDIDFVSAHGTATPDNDAMEAKALRKLFGDHLPAFASVKRFFGHTLAASGALKAVLAVQSLREQAVPGTPGFEVMDEKIGLEPIREFRTQPVSRIISNSFGFGGNNVALVFERADLAKRNTPLPAPVVVESGNGISTTRFAIFGTGVVSSLGCSLTEVAAGYPHRQAPVTDLDLPALSALAKAEVCAVGDFGADRFIEPAKRRRLSRIQQMTLVAARQALPAELLATTKPERICAVIGTGLGALTDTAAFVENMIVKEERSPRPALFTSSVHNSLASQVAIELGLSGLNSTPVQRETSFATALWQGANELASGRADLAVVGAADELNPYHVAAKVRQNRLWKKTPSISSLPGEGCAVFTLGRAGQSNAKPLAWVSAIRIGRSDLKDAKAEAEWIIETLERDGIAPDSVDLILSGTNSYPKLNHFYAAVAAEFQRRAKRPIEYQSYLISGDHHSAPAFGFFTAVGLVSGELRRGVPYGTVVLLTLSPSGTKGMCCVCA
jgi:3-oxoacyl-[acyl-carrier-protein] synthase II